MRKPRMILIIGCSLFLVCLRADAGDAKGKIPNVDRIRPYAKNPYYWQYKGEPLLLLGGSKDDNLFQIPDLKEHLDLLASVGGNYIRNTMSDRVIQGFEVPAFKKLPDGKYDLSQWNDEYWDRFETMLKLTGERDIVVQIEVWDRFDYTDNGRFNTWKPNPYNPANNINYTSAESGLETTYPKHHPGADKQPFFHTISAMDDNKVLRRYQEAFVNKMLSYSLPCGNVLYCMNNETSTPPIWGQYWMKYIEGKAADAGVDVYVTDMFDVGWELDTEEKFLLSFDRPDIYTFLDISQNNSNKNTFKKHWKNILFVRDRIKKNPRPINNTKNYGSSEWPATSAYHKRVWRRWTMESAVQRYVLNVIGGCASTRFHRNPIGGIGLTKPAQNCIKALRKLESLVKMWELTPRNDFLTDYEDSKVFLSADSGRTYALFFLEGGSASLNLTGCKGDFRLRWINALTGQWGEENKIVGGKRVTISAPDSGSWIAVGRVAEPQKQTGEIFIKIREVIWGDPSPVQESCIPYITDTIYQKYSVGNWDIARLRTYVDMLKAFGFNSLQLYDVWQRYFNAGWRIPPEDWSNCPQEYPKKADPRDWPEKMDAVADYARSIGLRTTLFVWGNAAFDYRNNTIPALAVKEVKSPERNYLEPDDPVALDILEQYWDHQAEHALHFDHIVTHWSDPGGCKGPACTIESAQKFHNEIVRRCRKKNPNIQSTFSLWMLHSSRFNKWRGYKDVHTILDSGRLPADVMISMDGGGGKFNLNDAKAISKVGRKVGIWGWYLADNEIRPSMHVRTNVLGKALGKLPPEAHNLIEWYSIDSNCHGLNMQNLYVAGKLMRNPKADARAALREFIAGAFGVENVARVEKVFRAIEGTRGYWSYKNISPANLPIAREAHKLATEITIPKGFKPAFPMVISPKEVVRELVAQTEVILEFMEFATAADKVEQMQKEGAGQGKIKAAIANLPKVSAPTEWLTNLEYVSYLKKLKELE